MPAISLSSVDFPEPLLPMKPKASPLPTLKETSASAGTTSVGARAFPRPRPSRADLSVPKARVFPQRR